MLKNGLILLFLFSMQLVYSQDVNWTDLDRKGGTLLDIIINPDNPNEFYALRWSGGQMFGSYKVSRHENLEKQSTERLKIHANNSIASFESIQIINGKLAVFLSDKRDGKNLLYVQFYDKNVKPIGEAKLLAEFELEKRGYKGWYKILNSKNNKFLGVVWQIPGRGDLQDRYGFNIYDEELNLINDGDYKLPFDPELIQIHSHLISNSGDYFLSMTEYSKIEKKKIFGPSKEFKTLHIYHIATDGLQDFEVEMDEKSIMAVAMSVNDQNVFTITGIFGEKNEKGVKGVFYKIVDLKDANTIREGSQEFTEDFITQGWTDRALNRAKRRERKGKGEPTLYSYEMKEAIIQKDGSIVGTLEQYYVEIRSSFDARSGQSSESYHYHYNDIIAYKINTEGEFEWLQKIRKYQVSTNDGGPFSSYETYLDSNSIHFIFNDNISNYSDNGDFKEQDRLYSANYSKRKNTVALASINIKTGDLDRKTLFDISEINAIAVPKLFVFDQANNFLLMYAIWSYSKEKFGILKID